jgi:hypothetical protein
LTRVAGQLWTDALSREASKWTTLVRQELGELGALHHYTFPKLDFVLRTCTINIKTCTKYNPMTQALSYRGMPNKDATPYGLHS